MFFVYILLCQDGSFYTGITKDLHKRFLAHQTGKGGAYTRSHKPQKIIYSEPHPDRSSALKREHQIKTWSKQEKTSFLSGINETIQL